MLVLVVRVRIGVATLTMLRDCVALLTTSTFLRGGRMVVIEHLRRLNSLV